MTLLDRFPANIYSLSLIHSKKVIIIGAGSVGLRVVESLTPLPFRKYVLIDPKAFKRSNIQRHLGGLSDIGKPKVDIGRRWLIEHGVAKSRIYTYATTHDKVLRYHRDADLVICCVDVEHVKMDVNGWCMELGISVIFASVYAGGIGGQVIVLPKPRDVCYQCAKFALGKLEYKGVPDDTDYGVDPTMLVSPEGDAMAVSSLGAPVIVTSGYAAILALEILGKGGEVPSQIGVLAFNDWIHMRVLKQGTLLKRITMFIASMPGLGMLPVWKLNGVSNGMSLAMQQSIFPQALSQWERCKLHSVDTVSADTI